MSKQEGLEILKKAIEKGELYYYKATGSYAYVAEYQDGEKSIVYNDLSAEAARPGVPFEIIAEARWYEGLGNPYWLVRAEDTDTAEVASTDLDGNVIDEEGGIWFEQF